MIHPDRAGWDDGWNRTTTSTTSRTVRGVGVTVHRPAHGAVVYVLRRPHRTPEQPRRPDDAAT